VLEGRDKVGADEENNAIVLLAADSAAHALLHDPRDATSNELAAVAAVFEVSI